MNVSLTSELERIVETKVASGRYGSASEVVREALRLMQERDEVIALQREEIRAKIAAGMASLRGGDVHDGDAVFERLETLLAKRAGQTDA